MKRKTKVRITVISSISFLIIGFIVFINIPFELNYIFIDTYSIAEEDGWRGWTDWNLVTRQSLDYFKSSEGLGDKDILELVKNPDDSVSEFNVYISGFDYIDYFLVYSSRKPIKKIKFKYNSYFYKFLNILEDSPKISENGLRIFIEFDESVELTDYFYLYKIGKKPDIKW